MDGHSRNLNLNRGEEGADGLSLLLGRARPLVGPLGGVGGSGGGAVGEGAGEGAGEGVVEVDDAGYVAVELADEGDVAAEATGLERLLVLGDLLDQNPVLLQDRLHLGEAPLQRLHRPPVRRAVAHPPGSSSVRKHLPAAAVLHPPCPARPDLILRAGGR